MANICPCTFGNSISHALNHLRKAKKLQEDLPEETGRATVISRRVDTCYSLEKTDSSWAYLVTFHLEDSQEIQLHVTESDYKKMKEGLSLSITWKGDSLTSHIIELG
jgi:hypothetical protein